MAAAFSQHQRLADGTDFSISHRPPPPVPSSTTHNHSHSASQHTGPDRQHASQVNNGRAGDERGVQRSQSQSHPTRRGSLPSFLRRSNTSSSSKSSSSNRNYDDPTVPPVPQLPNTRIAHAQAEAAARRARSNTGSSADHHRPGEGSEAASAPTMFRKASKSKPVATLPSPAAQHAPTLPSFTPGVSSFDHDGERPDSIAIFNNAYTHSAASASQSQSRAPANFSRPAMAPSSNINSSSSPAYTSRSGIAGPANSSSPPAVSSKPHGEYVTDPFPSSSQSMTNRGRFSYSSSINPVSSPRRVRRRKDPSPFNVLVIGAKNSGKTSFISFLRHTLALPAHKQASDHQPEPQIGGNRSSFKSDYLETEIDGERVGVTLWDSAGLEKNVVDLQLREMTAFVEAKFEDTFMEEQKVMRSPGVKDTHIHCIFLILDPVRLDTTIANSTAFHKHGSHTASLDEDLDLQVLRALWGKTTVIPVISKADTLTVNHMAFLKRAVWQALKGAKLDPLEALELEDDEEDEDQDDEADDAENSSEDGDEFPVPKTKKSHKRQSSLSINGLNASDDEMPYLPMSIISPDIYDYPPYVSKAKAAKADKVGRKFPWGFADPHNPEHCDFGRLRDSIFSEWRTDLRELSRSRWYENWRTSRLKNLPGSKQRVKGGVTPVTAVPREGRTGSGSTRQFSPPTIASAPSHSSLAGASSVPRSVSNATNTTAATNPAVGMAMTTNGDKNRNVSGQSQTGSVRGGVYRGAESFQ